MGTATNILRRFIFLQKSRVKNREISMTCCVFEFYVTSGVPKRKY
jgi:hypothetical protein